MENSDKFPRHDTPDTNQDLNNGPGTSHQEDERPGTIQVPVHDDVPGTSYQQEPSETEKAKKNTPKSRKKKQKKKHTSPSDCDHKSNKEEHHVLEEGECEAKKRKKQTEKSSSNPPDCCQQWCLRNVEPQVRETLNREYREELNNGPAQGHEYLCRYISHSEAKKQGERRNYTYDYQVPRIDDGFMDICQRAFLQIFQITQTTLRDARRQLYDVQIKEEPEDEVVIMGTSSASSSANNQVCNCINSQPVHFSLQISNTLHQFMRKMTNWFLYEIKEATLKTLFQKGYNSVTSLQSIAEEDLLRFGAIQDAQISLLRRFVRSLNCQQHPPVYPGALQQQNQSVPGMSTATTTGPAAYATVPSVATTNDDPSVISESALSPLDMRIQAPPPFNVDNFIQTSWMSQLQESTESSVVTSPRLADSPQTQYVHPMLEKYPISSLPMWSGSLATYTQSQHNIQKQNENAIVSEPLPALFPGGIRDILGGPPMPSSLSQAHDGNLHMYAVLNNGSTSRIASVSPTLSSRPSSTSSTLGQLQRFIQNASPGSNLSSPSPDALYRSLSPRTPTPGKSSSPTARPGSTSSTRSLHSPGTNVMNNISLGNNTSVHIWNVQNNMAVMSTPSHTAVVTPPSPPAQRQRDTEGLDVLSSAVSMVSERTDYNNSIPAGSLTKQPSQNSPSSNSAARAVPKPDLKLSSKEQSEINAQLYDACRAGNVTEVKNCLKQGAEINSCDTKDWEKKTALHHASVSGHDKVCQVLLQAGADVHATDEWNKQTALHHASVSGHDKVCQVLLQAGADVHATDKRNKQTALHRASRSGHDKVCQVLLQAGADVHATDKMKQTALYLASASGHDKVCQVLLQAGADVYATDVVKQTALHGASSSGHDKVCQVLLQAGADVHATDGVKETALHYASRVGHKVCQVLLQARADVHATDAMMRTALHYASRTGHDKVCQVLLQAGADVHDTDGCGKKPIDVAGDCYFPSPPSPAAVTRVRQTLQSAMDRASATNNQEDPEPRK